MKVFISWSGERSCLLAQALHSWLPLVLHYVKPWLSEADVSAGDRWAQTMAKELETSNFGIICVTPENIGAPWVLFEAGALAKSLQGARVVPLLLDLEASDIGGPLAQFQAKKVERNGLATVVSSINQMADDPVPEDRRNHLFAALWPELEKQITSIPNRVSTAKHMRPQHEILEELVGIVRGLDGRLRELEGRVAEKGLRRQRRSVSKLDRISVPEWMDTTERDSLHRAVDDLHRKIIGFAKSVGARGWEERRSGNNVVAAFRELDEDYQPSLRYCLSVYNLHALGAEANDEVSRWRSLIRERWEQMRPALEGIFRASHAGVDWAVALAHKTEEFERAMAEVFPPQADAIAAKQMLREIVEQILYRARLTPGYWIMDSKRPEVISTWLRDPRAKRFDQYPAKLLLWEASQPETIFYSPISDDSVPVGVCGINADILEHCSAHELQEIIDESAPRLRRELATLHLHELRKEVRGRRETLGKDIRDEFLMWVPTLRRFRQLAYCYFPRLEDFFTKLVRNPKASDTEAMKLWRSDRWTVSEHRLSDELPSPTMEEIQILRNMSHIGKGRGEADFLQIRIDTYYLRELQRGDAIKALRDSLVHRIRIPDAESISLLLFTPDPEHLQFATDLVQEFVDTCRAAISDYHNYLNGLARIDAGHAEPITDSSFRTLVPPSLPDTLQMDPYDVFVSYNSADRAFVDKVVTELERHNLNPWYDQRQLRVGESWLDAITQQINQVRSALVFIGTHGMGNWQEPEIKWMVLKLREKRRPVIPVIMPGATPANIPLFLREFSAVDYNTDRDATTRIIEAIRAASPPRRSRATRRRD